MFNVVETSLIEQLQILFYYVREIKMPNNPLEILRQAHKWE